jgi:hypothetical protein
MFAQFMARLTAVGSARGRPLGFHFRILAVFATIAAALAGCMPQTVPLAGADPADSSVKVASVGYKSTIAPYASMRPSTPRPWRERNDSDAPQSSPDR